MKRIKLALVGDFDEKIHTHVALNRSIEHCARALSYEVVAKWIPLKE
jgi:CTP synthase (UTP-ammonia lyase)